MTGGLLERRLSDGDYQAIFHNVSDGLMLHPPESDEILDANERFAEMLGYDREELLECTVPDITADDWDPPKSAAERIQQARDEGTVKFEWRDQRKDGTAFWVEVNLTLVDLEADEYVLASVRDISDRKQYERRARAVFDHTYQFTGLLEPDGTLLEANQTALEFGGLERSEVVGERFWNCYWWQVDPETRREVRDAVGRAADGEFVRYETEVQGSEGTELIDFSIRPVRDDQGRVTLLVPEGRIITDKRARRQRLDVYNRLMRHNIRNKLTVVNGYARQIAEDAADDDVRALAEEVVSSGRRLQALAEQIREFDKAKQQAATTERVDVGDLVASVTDRYGAEAGTTAVDAAVEDGLVLRTNRRLLRMALQQLVENAVEYTDGPVDVSVAPAEGPRDGVVITVSDSGDGIDRSEVAPVLDGSISQLEHTSGIGLWVVKWCLDELGGQLAFEGDEDGTTAVVELPEQA